ncbi:MAG: hypothetical protein Ct9H90mP27_3700 [Gammaproteobacteria bacterium]|nr:MAG: hypothetical protein Ct9H90mP27_3700 [Gammaproteobacteria bacterium]
MKQQTAADDLDQNTLDLREEGLSSTAFKRMDTAFWSEQSSFKAWTNFGAWGSFAYRRSHGLNLLNSSETSGGFKGFYSKKRGNQRVCRRVAVNGKETHSQGLKYLKSGGRASKKCVPLQKSRPRKTIRLGRSRYEGSNACYCPADGNLGARVGSL